MPKAIYMKLIIGCDVMTIASISDLVKAA